MESVIIDDGAKIADDVTIGPFCLIGKDIELKSGCSLESNVVLKGRIRVDEDVRIFSFTATGHEYSEIEIGTKTYIREFSQIGSQESEKGISKKIIIGANNFLMGYVQILSRVTLGDYCILTNAVRLNENVKCEERVTTSTLKHHLIPYITQCNGL